MEAAIKENCSERSQKNCLQDDLLVIARLFRNALGLLKRKLGLRHNLFNVNSYILHNGQPMKQMSQS